jgi:hypothetical protein
MAKYSKQYKQNRKIKTGKKVLDGLETGPDGNPIINNTSSPFGANPNYLGTDASSGNYSDGYTGETYNNNQMNAGQYAAIGTAAATAGANYAQAYNDPNASLSDKSEAGRTGAAQIAGSINPVVGGIISGANAIAKPIKTNAERTDSQGNLVNQKGAQAGAIAGNFLSPSTLATTISEGKWDLTGKKYATSLEADAKAKIDEANAPMIAAAEAEKNKYYTFESGGNLTRYETGGKHSESPHGGIPIGPTSLVEEGETRGMENTPTKDYIYSDTLKVPGKKYSYAKASKMIESKYSKRDNDKMSKEAMEREITSLMHSQEELREGMMNKAYKKAFGGELNDPTVASSFDPMTLKHQLGKGEKGYSPKQLIEMGYKPGKSEGEYITPQGDYTYYKPQPFVETPIQANPVPKPTYTYNQHPWERQGNLDYNKKVNGVPTFMYGGKMQHGGTDETSFLQDVEKDKRTIPFETPGYYNNGFGVDNTNMNNAVNDLGQAFSAGPNAVNNFDNTNKLALTANTARGYVPPTGYVPKYNPYAKSLKPFNLNDNKFSNMDMNPGNNVTPENKINTPIVNSPNNTDSNIGSNNVNDLNLYNAGNFMGGLYDIGRGIKGGDPVNYERVNPELVDFSASREMNRRDSKEGFKNMQKELRNVNNPGQYLSLITQNAAQRDKSLFDSNTKSFENEKNINVGARNQSKYFNAQVQKQEADARQMEKDIASNTLQSGIADFGEAFAGTGRDKAAVVSQAESKKFIGSTDYSPIKDKKGKIVGYKHKSSNKTYKIEG